jgi:hypothetical protein
MTGAQAIPDDAEPAALLAAYLTAHAQEGPVAAALFAKGEAVYRRLQAAPPPSADWGRFLVAQGELAAERLGDDASASRYFLAALESVRVHGDAEVAVTAGYDQAVLIERGGDQQRALTAYRTAADEGLRIGALHRATLAAAFAAIRLDWDRRQALDAPMRLRLKTAWLAWLWLRRAQVEPLPGELASEARRTLAAFLLPEDDQSTLLTIWTGLPPNRIDTPAGEWRDDDPACLNELVLCAIEAAEEFLREETPEPAAPYRALLASLTP